MFHVDPLPDHLGAGHHDLQPPAGRIFPLIVRVEKGPSTKSAPRGQVAAPDDKGGVPRETPFRPDLAPVAAPSARLPRRAGWRQGARDLRKSSASFPAVPKRGLSKVGDQAE